MPDKNNQVQFTFVSNKKPKLSAVTFSFLLQILGLILMIQYWVVMPGKPPEMVVHYQYTPLAPETPTAQPEPPKQVLKQTPAPRPDLDKYFEAKLRVPTRVTTAAPSPKVELPEIKVVPKAPVVQLPQTAQVRLAPQVKTGAFSSGSSATPTIKNVPASQVQTGGFGDPNGIRGVGKGDAKLVAAAYGSFDLPGGPGVGNGTGGKNGMRGAIASAGFGNGVATSNPGNVVGGGTARGAIQQGGFGDSRPAEQTRTTRTAAAPVEAKTIPVQILSKPVPVYTAEARALKLEGDVVLEVLFSASGQARVTRVIRGLGHGLDEAATHAVAQIRFTPAKRDGQSVDSASVIHVVFQLAY